MLLALNPGEVSRVHLERGTDWQVYVAICGLGQATPREIAQEVKVPVGKAVASLRRLAEEGLVRPGGLRDGRPVVRPVAWRDVYDEPQMAGLFGLKPGDLYLKGMHQKGGR